MDTLVQPERLDTSVIPMFYAPFALMNPAPPKLEAIHWLEKALQHQDDPEGEVTVALALMYGYSDAYDLMLDTIQKARTLSLSLISFFQRPVHLMMLIYACHSLASVEEASRVVWSRAYNGGYFTNTSKSKNSLSPQRKINDIWGNFQTEPTIYYHPPTTYNDWYYRDIHTS